MQVSVIRRTRSPLALAVAMAFGAGSAHAATITVADGGDSGSPTTCTLRQAIEAANTDASVGACAAGAGADIIEFGASLANATITLAGSELAVAASTTLTVNGSSQIIDANAASRVINVADAASLALSQVTVTGGNVIGGGGGNRPSKANRTTGSNAVGGGIYLAGAAILSIANSTITGNTASGDGGGVYAFDDNSVTIVDSTISGNTSGSDGGGMYVFGSVLDVSGSTISGNIADGEGGGLYARSSSAVSIVNSTFHGNSAATGGAVSIKYEVALSAINSTISGNTASAAGGGIYASAGYGGPSVATGGGGGGPVSLTLANTILTGNTAPANADLYSDSPTNIVSLASSFLGSALQANFSGSGNVFNDAPGLGALADNGGPTLTMLPQTGSPAIDAGDNSLIPAGVSTDQRGAGFVRVFNTSVDIGAVEVQALVPDGGGPSIPVPVRAPWALGLLGALLALVGWRGRRRYRE